MGRYSDESMVEYPHFMKEKLSEYETEILAELMKLDLSSNEAKILLHLMIYNNSTASEIARLSGIQRTETYHYLASLLAKGVLRTTFDRPQRYYALSYKETVDHLSKVKMSSLNAVMEKKEYYHEIINRILDHVVQRGETERDVYQVIVGKEALIAKVHNLIANAKKEIVLLLSEAEVMLLYRNELIDELHKSALKGIQVSLKSPSATVSRYVNDENGKSKIAVRVIDDSSAPVGCIIFDNEEMITFIESNSQGFKDSGTRVFYTNNKKLISAFKVTADRS
jgi:sugar-specific transcriptional regulator TrmB